ncbi:MAG: bifunctional UDP-N-acetylmuramoyl-tripeptide:D-alanyl-D-alanine ligase/alanine racemase [Bacteroidia bacterium]
MKFHLKDIAETIQSELILGEASPTLITEISFDSRKIHQAGNSLFIALKTERNDGHRYLDTAYRAGVRNFLVSSLPEQIKDANYLLVKDTFKAIQLLSQNHRSHFSGKVIGITGSNGKTWVKEWLNSCLSNYRETYRSPRSYNSQLGVALSVLGIPLEKEFALIEAGISMPNEMNSLEEMILPQLGIFTNIRSAHAENFENITQHILEKLKLFRRCNKLIVSSDYPEIIEQAKSQNIPLFVWGKNEKDDIAILRSRNTKKTCELSLKFKAELFELSIPFNDEASVENAMHVCAAMLACGIPTSEISKEIAQLQALEMRLEFIQGKRNCTIINDTWSADLDSLRIALEAMDEQSLEKRTLIVSDLLETGSKPEELYSKLAELCARKKVTRIIGVGEQISRFAHFFGMEKQFFISTEALINHLPVLDFKEECILLKGARIFEFERIASQLQEKTHETVLEINLSAMVENLNFYRSLAGKNVKTMAMVKAFAYGSGSIEIAHVLQFHGIDYLAVAYADEGVVLRKAGINTPILVLSPETDSLADMLEYNLEPEIYSFRMLDLFLAELGRRNQDETARVQIKLDTGMHRLGFEEKEIPELIEKLKSEPRLQVVGVFSHLAASGEPEYDDFTLQQIQVFERGFVMIQEAFGTKIFRHILNSSGIKRFPEARFEMVRLGIGLYGIGYSEEQNYLKDVSRLQTTLSQIRTLEPSETVGYSRKGKLSRTSRIATVPVGYADGFLRKLGNGKSGFKIHGKFAPTIGNICMDMCMVDVTDIPEAKEGDIVVIFENADDIRRLAETLETIPYEILTGVSERVKRVYIQE